jgi:hypothetical protein
MHQNAVKAQAGFLVARMTPGQGNGRNFSTLLTAQEIYFSHNTLHLDMVTSLGDQKGR